MTCHRSHWTREGGPWVPVQMTEFASMRARHDPKTHAEVLRMPDDVQVYVYGRIDCVALTQLIYASAVAEDHAKPFDASRA